MKPRRPILYIRTNPRPTSPPLPMQPLAPPPPAQPPAHEPPTVSAPAAANPSTRRHGSTSRRRMRAAHPLRFMWQMDAEGRFSLGSDEFTRLIGARTAAASAGCGAKSPRCSGSIPKAASPRRSPPRNTWSGITLNWPVDGGGRLPVELSGLPVFDRARNFAGYRGFGVCRDLDGLARLAALRRYEFFSDPPPQPLSADIVRPDPAAPSPAQEFLRKTRRAPISHRPSRLTLHHALRLPSRLHTKPIWKPPWKPPRTSCRFGPISEPKAPSLTPVENSAFNELARQLSARLESETGAHRDAGRIRHRRKRSPNRRPAETCRTGQRTARLAGAARAAARAAKPGATRRCSTCSRSAS